jgi:hypothetical protein
MATVSNYTAAKRREKQVYDLLFIHFRSGIALGVLSTTAILLVPFTVIGLIFCKVTDTLWYNPLLFATGNSSAVGYFLLIFIGAPIGLGMFLNSYKIQNYKAIDYLKLYFVPKTPINARGRKKRIEQYKIKSFVEKF